MNKFNKRIHKITKQAMKDGYIEGVQATCYTYSDYRKVVRAMKKVEKRKPVKRVGNKKRSLYEKMWQSAIVFINN